MSAAPARSWRVETGWFPVPGGHASATVLHPVAPNGCAVVIGGSYGMESLAGARVLDSLAAALADAGWTVVSFSPPGLGDASDPPHHASLVAPWLAAADSAMSLARAASGSASVSVIGLRLGATVLATAAAARDDVDGVVLWAPVAGRPFTRELRMLGAASVNPVPVHADGSIESAGFVMSAATAGDLAALDVTKLACPPGRRHLVIDRDDVAACGQLASAVARLDAPVELVDWPGFAGLHLEDPELGAVPHGTLDLIVAWLATGDATAKPDTTAPPCSAPTLLPVMAGPSGAWQERAVRVTGSEGAVIHGVLTEPTSAASGAGAPAEGRVVALILSTGRNPACGPGRIHVDSARHWAAHGVVTLRVERRGVGITRLLEAQRTDDDQGSLAAYDPVQVADAHRLIGHCRDDLRADHLVVVGTCSGAYAAQHAVADGAAPDTVVCINQMVFDRPDGSDTGDAAALAIKARYQLGRAAVDPHRWLDLLRGDVRVIPAVRRLREYACIRLGRRPVSRHRRRSAVDGATPDLADLLAAAARRSIRQCFFFDADDPGLAYLRFRAGAQVDRLQARGAVRLDTVRGAGHTFGPSSSRPWLRERLDQELGLVTLSAR